MARQNDNRSKSRRTSGQVFFGGLAADDDATDDVVLPPVFAELMDRARTALREYRARNLDAKGLADVLSSLVVVDGSGDEWTVGASSLDWYRRTPGLPWTKVDPPSASVRLDQGTTGATGVSLDELDQVAAAASDDAGLLAGQSPWAGAPAPVAADDPAPGTNLDPAPGTGGAWSGAVLSSRTPVDSPPTTPLDGPFSSLPPRPGYADGPLTGSGIGEGADAGAGAPDDQSQ